MSILLTHLRKTIVCGTLALAACLPVSEAVASDVGVKTNVLYDATATVNLGVEMRLAPKWSIDISGNFNAWKPGGHSLKHWLAQPELRYWLCEGMGGHFFGAHLIGGQYNVYNLSLPLGLSVKDYRYQGWGIGAGVSYGYTWLLNKHWSAEAEIGIGYVWMRYDKFECETCGRKVEGPKTRNYVGPTKAAINLVYVF